MDWKEYNFSEPEWSAALKRDFWHFMLVLAVFYHLQGGVGGEIQI